MLEMTIELQANSNKCLYEQIYEYVKQEIKEGKLLQGERLPSTRSLAENLQISRSTAEMAYGQLVSEGYIEPIPYKGYFVAKIEELYQLGNRELPVKKQGAGGSTTLAEKKYSCDFSLTKIDMTEFPFSVWSRIHKMVLSEGSNTLFLPGAAQGDYGLRETIARYLHASRGVDCTPEQIVVGAGNDYLLMLLEKILGREFAVAMENPTYKRAYQVFGSCGYPVNIVEMDENGMSVEALSASNSQIAYVMPSRQYPTGIVMPIGRRSELLKWANQQENRYLLEDDYDSEFRYKGKPIPSLQSYDKNGRVIYMGTFSKAIAPSIRVSYMVLPLALVKKYQENCYFYSSTVSRIDQKVLDEFIRGGYFERHLNKMRKCYKEKHDALLEILEPFRKVFHIEGENAGLHLLLTHKGDVTEKQLLEAAAEVGVKVYGLTESYVGSIQHIDSHTVMLGYGGLSVKEMESGIEELKKAWL